MSEELQLVDEPQQITAFSNAGSFESAQRMALALSSSSIVPESFRGKQNLGNCLIALEVAQRLGASPLAVMQNLYIVHGKPAWSSQFVIAAVNSTGRYTPLRFDISGEGEKKQCIAWATEKETGQRLESPAVSIAMAKAEGWIDKNGSKWRTMPDLMLRYRAATFFGRLYAPEILLGMSASEEIEDAEGQFKRRMKKIGPAEDLAPASTTREEKIAALKAKCAPGNAYGITEVQLLKFAKAPSIEEIDGETLGILSEKWATYVSDIAKEGK